MEEKVPRGWEELYFEMYISPGSCAQFCLKFKGFNILC